jgi:hypothetical protein
VHYLAERRGWDFIRRIWQECRPDETPVQTIDRLFEETNDRFRDAEDTIDDFFAAGYCVDSFLTAPLCPVLHERFGDRLIRGAFEVEPGTSDTLKGVVWPLGCLYFRINTGQEALGFRVAIEGDKSAGLGLKARLFGVAGETRRGAVQRLVASRGSDGAVTLAASIAPDPDVDYYVLVVANVRCVEDSNMPIHCQVTLTV